MHSHSTLNDSLTYHADYSLQALNTLGLSAKARFYCAIHSLDQLRQALAFARMRSLPWLVLGGGSNLVLTQDYAGVVLHLKLFGRQLLEETTTHWRVQGQAGEMWHPFVQWTLQQGWSGLENLALIPGTVGAAPIQNIGAYGMELKDRLESLEVFDSVSGQVILCKAHDCDFSYRDSIFKRQPGRYIVLSVIFALPKRWQPVIDYRDIAVQLAAQSIHIPTAQQIFDVVVRVRQEKLPDPARIGNVGSFFKNPIVSAAQQQRLLKDFPQLVSYVQPDGSYKLAAAWLIDQCGWKGKSLGHAKVHDKQALVLTNPGGASGAEIMQLAQAIQRTVAEKFAVQLEPEPTVL